MKYILFYSGEEKQGGKGTAFMTVAKFGKRVIEFKKIISYMRKKNNLANILLLNVYAPTNERRYDMLTILADLNANIRREEYIRHVAGNERVQSKTTDNVI